MNLDTSKPEVSLDTAQVQAIYESHAPALRRFLLGLLRDDVVADDALQSTFRKLVEKGHTVNSESIRSWLFQVAYNEAMMVHRKDAVQKRWFEQAAWEAQGSSRGDEASGLQSIMRSETVERVRAAIKKLDSEQERVLRLRVYEGMKFKDIATELSLPLGTVLSRMRSALQQLKKILTNNGDSIVDD